MTAPVLWLTVGIVAASALRPSSADREISATPPGSARRDAVVGVVESCREAVVGIEVTAADATDANGETLWIEAGSGVLINARGFILSNYHVVRDSSAIRVRLADGRKLDGAVEAVSEASDLVLIRVRGVGRAESGSTRTEPLDYASLGDSDELLAGETVVSIGSPYGLSHTVSRGVVSATERAVRLPNGREYADFIQTDAAINPGNSGGGLFNLAGELVGINAAIFNQGWGIAFAIPVDRIKDLLTTYVTREHSTGLVVEPNDGGGLLVRAIGPGSPASAAGLAIGDVLLFGNGQPLDVEFDLVVASLGATSAQPLRVFARRDGDELAVDVGAESLPWQRLGVDVSDGRFGRGRGRDVRGVLIAELLAEGPAERGGLRVGDLIVEVTVGLSEKPTTYRIENESDFRLVLERFGRGRVRVAVLRDGERRESIVVPRRPGE